MRLFRLLMTFLFGALVGPVTAPGAASANAVGDVELACTYNVQFNLAEPLTATKTETTWTGTGGGSNCMSPTGSYPNLRSSVIAPWTGTASSVPGTNPCPAQVELVGEGTINWSPGEEKSRFEIRVDFVAEDGTLGVSGKTLTGPLRGTYITALPVVGHTNPDCAVTGLTSITSEVTEVLYHF
ncbi:hypothetical protein GCM10012275_00860 [Longimycelium tulufanense]|uniref:Ig-like domain-containing protein n=1 Tax=Longimycelium tulufanense TaxID=907463 RepID=A0A8J3FTC4_9PSEU|nr:hypothetical protein [Longimycelium tulufanense]GGM33216.1 hypothetical protein GCM10012275_00860 [Longimycelium tulufanense]